MVLCDFSRELVLPVDVPGPYCILCASYKATFCHVCVFFFIAVGVCATRQALDFTSQ